MEHLYIGRVATLGKSIVDEYPEAGRKVGYVTSQVTIPRDNTYLFFYIPEIKQSYVVTSERLNFLRGNIMWFGTLEEASTYFNEYRARNKGSKNINYSVTAKKAFVEFIQRNEISVANCARAAGVSTFSIKHWKDQHAQGLYNNLDAVTKVSMKTKKTHSSAVEYLEKLKADMEKKHEQDIINIGIQIHAIKDLESKGFTISRNNIM